jgi:hypothetical protein
LNSIPAAVVMKACETLVLSMIWTSQGLFAVSRSQSKTFTSLSERALSCEGSVSDLRLVMGVSGVGEGIRRYYW